MSEETEILDAEIRKKFKKADKDEFVIGDKYRLRITTRFGEKEPKVDVLDLENSSDVSGAGISESHQISFRLYVGGHKSFHAGSSRRLSDRR